jgi:hypothetical protein
VNDIRVFIGGAVAVFGAAIVLATWSAARAEPGRTVTQALDAPANRLWMRVGLALVASGMAGADPRGWAKIVWAILAAAALGDACVRQANLRRKRGSDHGADHDR